MLSRNLIIFGPEALTRRSNRCPRDLRVLIDNNLWMFPAETGRVTQLTHHNSDGEAYL
jgi:hypothetical protein